jgi:predicted regulator of Ras-like GTPase activity (Roadblock/LC7/MglB family)
MTFAQALEGVRACRGVIATAIADRDGIPVESFGGDRAQVEEVVAEFSGFMREVASANRELQLGTLEQVTVTGTERTVVLSTITDEYFLMTVVERGGNPGKARFASRLAAFRLRREFL